LAVVYFLIGWATGWLPATAAETVPVGIAHVDITPDHPVRLVGYASRQTESEGVAQRIWAKALAIGSNEGDGPAVLIMVENCGVPAAMTAQVAGRLEAQAGLKRERVVLCSTHIHTGPWLAGLLTLHTAGEIPAEHFERMKRYTERLTGLIVQVAEQALAARKPAVLSWTQGSVGFAMNRRPVKDGRCPGLGVNPQGAVDHSLPLLRVTDPQGKLLAVVLNYACHGTTLGDKQNKVHGDWAGCAQEFIEAEHSGTTAIVCLGCGADANPEPRNKWEFAPQHGRAMADEVNRLLAGTFKPITPKLTVRSRQIQLPYDTLPTREEFQSRVAKGEHPKASGWDKRMATHARAMLALLDRGALPTTIDYPVTTWTFGDDLGMVFLPGEVVVDFALRLKKELDGSRLWVTAYANDVPCYIVSRRILQEGGYEPDTSIIGYGRPTRLAPTVEDLVIETVESLLPASLATKR
jgi:hypothetical protein